MLDVYNDLLNKIRITGNYIDKLVSIEGEMTLDVVKNRLELKVKDILEKCIDDINEIYINHECAVNTSEVIDEYNQELIILNEDIIHTLNTIGIIDDLKQRPRYKDHLMNMFSLLIDDNTISDNLDKKSSK